MLHNDEVNKYGRIIRRSNDTNEFGDFINFGMEKFLFKIVLV